MMADDGPFIVVFGSSLPLINSKKKNTKKRCQYWTPLSKLSGSAHGGNEYMSFSDVVFIMLTKVKMPTVVGTLTFMSRINSMLS